MAPVAKPWQERFWTKVRKTDTCWEWTGAKTGGGYGKLGVAKGDIRNAHRLSWEIAHGRPIPPGMVIDHLCSNRACVNPAHLEAVTQAANVQRSRERGRMTYTQKTHCKHGHAFTEENTYVTKTQRACKECRRKRSRERARWLRQQARLPTQP